MPSGRGMKPLHMLAIALGVMLAGTYLLRRGEDDGVVVDDRGQSENLNHEAPSPPSASMEPNGPDGVGSVVPDGSIVVKPGGFSQVGASGWLTDDWEPGVMWSMKLGEKLFDKQSAFQWVTVHDTPSLGRVLSLDGIIQASERDEAGYHELIAHIALCRKGSPESPGQRALVIGGGDGGSAREILRHSKISAVDMVEIDPMVVLAAKAHLPSIWKHPFEVDPNGRPAPLHADTRLTVHHVDALKWLQGMANQSTYDVIVIDASDPMGPGVALYTTEFYQLLKGVLRPGGAVTVQGGSFFWFADIFTTVFHQLSKVFPVVKPYQCFTAIYPGGVWNLQVATLGDDPAEVDPAKVAQIRMGPGEELGWYSEQTHTAAFAVPPYALKVLKRAPKSLPELSALLSVEHNMLDWRDRTFK